MKSHYLLVVGLVGVVTLILLSVPAPQAQTTPFIKLAQVTNDEIVDLYPDVSPDGGKLAYMSYRKKSQYIGNFDIVIMDIKTGKVQVLDEDEADDAFPAWMADGETVLFDSYRRVDARAIWKKKISGGAVERLGNMTEVALNADCSPDNKRIVFTATDQIKKDVDLRRDGLFFVKFFKKLMPNIYVVNTDGSNLHFLNVQGVNPKWSPDNRRIVFASNEFGNYEIFSVAVDGSDRIRLTSREAQDIEPAWSPDGRFIVFTSDDGDNWNLWVIKPDGTGLTQLTAHEEFEGGPAWAMDPENPEEWYIYFHSDDNGNWDIWRLRPTEFKPLPNPALHDRDHDGVSDDRDQCPDQPEDVDGFQDQDGCPDPDNDNDGIPDAQDQCPGEAETFNGYKDADGCPDAPPLPPTSTLSVTFKENSAELAMDSIPALESLVEKLKDWTTARVRIKVYTDANQHRRKPELTRLRALAIKQYLISRGIAAERIEAVGMGDSDPVAGNRTAAERRQNNRVILEIVQ